MVQHAAADQGQTGSAQADGFAIHVVLALPSGGQRELTTAIGLLGKPLQQAASGVVVETES